MDGNTIVKYSSLGPKISGRHILFSYTVEISVLSALISDPEGTWISPDIILLPDDFRIAGTHLNPSNSRVNIEFQIQNDSEISMKIHNLLGQEMTTLIDDDWVSGRMYLSKEIDSQRVLNHERTENLLLNHSSRIILLKLCQFPGAFKR